MPWHHLPDPNDPELDELGKRYNLHPLHIDDCRSLRQRVKIEETPDYLFTVLRPVNFNSSCDLTFSMFCMFTGRDYCVTTGGTECPAAEAAVKSARELADPGRSDQVYYRIFDAVVDGYLPAIDCISEKIDDLEDVVLNDPSPYALQEIFGLKRALIDLRRVLVNTRDVGTHLQRNPGSLISSDLAPFFRDIYDHVARNLDSVETHRDLLNGTLDVYLSSMANRTNNVMKVLTVLSTIALPAIVISGIYGMNVKGLPFLDNPHATWIVTGTIVATTFALLAMLKRFGWF
jgi:magnesium transporter